MVAVRLLLSGATRFRKQFKDFVKRISKQRTRAYGALRRLVQPTFRLKTDPNIVPDLPKKTEMRGVRSFEETGRALSAGRR